MQKAKLIWQCRRGMLELDLILSDFVMQNFEKLSAPELASLEKLLQLPDPLLYAWLMNIEVANMEFEKIVKLITLYRDTK